MKYQSPEKIESRTSFKNISEIFYIVTDQTSAEEKGYFPYSKEDMRKYINDNKLDQFTIFKWENDDWVIWQVVGHRKKCNYMVACSCGYAEHYNVIQGKEVL